jgi:predicted ATP-binding protein involved in virulence
MRVKELKLHNFRGIKDLHLIFNTEYNVVVLVGVNGIGKSSILDCINFSIKYYKEIFDSYNSYLAEPYNYRRLLLDSDIYIKSNETINQIKVKFGGNWIMDWKIARLRIEQSNYIDHIEPWGEIHRESWEHITDNIEQRSDTENWNLIHQESRENIADSNDVQLTNHFFYYLSNRQVIHSSMHHSIEVENIINFKDFSKWFKDIEDLENEIRLSDNIEYRHPVLSTVRHAIYSLLGKGYENLTFKRAIDQMTINKSDQEIAVELLSDGEKSLLAMVGHLSRKLAEDYDNLEAFALVLIDEIELHLHPAWQRMIIPRLTQTFPNCQFIVTTHSPQVLSHVDPECIHILDYDGYNVVVKRPDSSYGLDSNRILEDILGVSKRPQEIQDRMSELFRTINNNDLEGAKEIVQELGDKIGMSEPELVKAEATIKRREIIGR